MSERLANYLIRCNYRDFLLKNVIINYNEPKKGKKNREIEVSFLETVNSSEISERFANYIIRGNYRNFLSKNVVINHHEPKK